MVKLIQKQDQIRGICASDLDGTLSFRGEPIAPEILEMFESLHKSGWLFLFATGRTLLWAKKHLSTCHFPYYLAPFNGATLWQKEQDQFFCLYSYIISRKVLELLLPYIHLYGAVIYEALPKARIFVYKTAFSPQIWDHVEMRRRKQNETWESMFGLVELPKELQEASSLRFFFRSDDIDKQKEVLHALSRVGLHGVAMKDSFSPDMRIVQVTAHDATKKTPVTWLKKHHMAIPVLGIGDDSNDIPMFEASDLSIAIHGASEEVQSLADYVTRGNTPQEIIDTVLQAISKINV